MNVAVLSIAAIAAFLSGVALGKFHNRRKPLLAALSGCALLACIAVAWVGAV